MISTTTAEHYIWGDSCDGWHLVRQPDLSVISERMPAGTAEVHHSHNRARQFFYVLRGEVVMEMNGQIETLVAHQGIEIAPGVPHQIRNESGRDAEFLVISQPPAQDDRIPAPLEFS